MSPFTDYAEIHLIDGYMSVFAAVYSDIRAGGEGQRGCQ